jgi:hypothetical protein
LLTIAVVGFVVGLAWWSGGRKQGEYAPTAAQEKVDRDVQACQSDLQPKLQGQVLVWRLSDETATANGMLLTFVANIDGQVQMYNCELTQAGSVLVAERSR